MKQPGQIAIGIFVVIIMAVVILQAGRYSYVQDNGSQNFGPSGTSAFLELVKQSGYKVSVDNSISPRVGRKLIVPVSAHNREAFQKFLKRVKGKTQIVAFVIPMSDDKTGEPRIVRTSVNRKEVGNLEPMAADGVTWEKPLVDDAETVTLLERQDNSGTVAESTVKGDLEMVHMPNAECITNRNLDKSNNASIVMGLVRSIAKSGEDVVFVDTFAAQDVETSLLAKMGPPFQAAWNQILVLILVIFITLSVRFGLPPVTRAKQRGGRELVDGLATMTRRKKNARWALRAVFDRSLAELERRHRIGREQIIQRPDLYMNSEDAMSLKLVEAATLDDISEQDAIRHAKELKRLV